MKGKTNKYLNRRTIFTFILIGLLNLSLILIFDYSLENVIVISITSFIFFSLAILSFPHIGTLINFKKSYNEGILPKLILLFGGVCFLIIFNFFFFKFYALGASLIIISLLSLILVRKVGGAASHLRRLDENSKGIFTNMIFNTMIFWVLTPLILDLNYTHLNFGFTNYLIILISYFLIICGIMILSLFRKINS